MNLNRALSKEEVQMAEKYTKKCLTFLAIKEMKIKTMLRFHFTPFRSTIKNINNNKYWGKKNLHTLLVECQLACGKQYGGSSKKLKPQVSYDREIPLLGIYLKECKSDYNKGTCTPMFTAALFIMAKLWEQPRCPLLMNGLRKCGIYIQWNFYSTIKKNELFLFPGKWMELENIILSEVNQVQKA
jgi:hypothetical protein